MKRFIAALTFLAWCTFASAQILPGILAGGQNGTAGGGGSTSVTYVAEAGCTGSGTTCTTSSISIGTADTNRRVIVIFAGEFSATVNSITIAGTAVTLHQCTAPAWQAMVCIGSLVVPTGTTAAVVVNFASTIFTNGFIATYTVDDTTLSGSTPDDSDNQGASSGTSVGNSLTVGNNGFVVGAAARGTYTGSETMSTPSGYTGDATDSADRFVYFHKNSTSSGTEAPSSSWTTSAANDMATIYWGP